MKRMMIEVVVSVVFAVVAFVAGKTATPGQPSLAPGCFLRR